MSVYQALVDVAAKCDGYAERFLVFYSVFIAGLAANLFITPATLIEALFARDPYSAFLLWTVGGTSFGVLLAMLGCGWIALCQACNRDEGVGVKTRQLLLALVAIHPLLGVATLFVTTS